MRTTIDIPDPIYRELKARAARQGHTVKEIILKSVKREIRLTDSRRSRVRLPLIRGKETRKLELTNAQIDQILFG
jgi:tRNA threonylcarbamoyladenosine modification (KEOPS) complex  Pcc1 subunit